MIRKYFRITAACLSAACLMSLAVSGELQVTSNLSGTNFQTNGRDPSEGFQDVLFNAAYTLSYRDSTAEIAVRDNHTGATWYSNPQDMESYPDISPDEKTSLYSQIIVTYADGQKIRTMNSYADSVFLVQHTAGIEGDTFWVDYQFGKATYTNDLLPAVISQVRMEKVVFSKLTQDERDQILTQYDFFDIKKMDPETAKTILVNFPILKKHSIYVRKQFPDYLGESIYALFKKAGYTTDDLAKDCKENEVKNTYVEPVTFRFRLGYKLTATGFTALLDNSKTRYDAGHPPLVVQILPAFGCANTTDTGYMFVPDGSGAVIRLNNGKTLAESYWEPLFGEDKAMCGTETEAIHQSSLLPVFAASSQRSSFLANIDEGYECAGITANVAGQKGTYNAVGAFFNLFPYGTVSLNGSYLSDTSFVQTAPRMFSGNISISYHLMGANASIGDFAALYRSILKDNGTLPKSIESDRAATLDLIGTASERAKFFGIPYTKLTALTTFNQAAKLVDELGTGHISIKYTNAANGGLNQKQAEKIRLERVLGSASEFRDLQSHADVYVSLNAQTVNHASNSNTARALSKDPVKVYQYDPITRYYNRDGSAVLLSSLKLGTMARSLVQSLSKSGVQNIDFQDIGYQLNSDFNISNPCDRRQARIAVQSHLKTISGTASVSARYGSYFSLPYLSMIWDIPNENSGYTIEDESVPFYAMVIRGSIPYSTSPINESGEPQKAFLQAVSIGAQAQFSWVYQNTANAIDSRELYCDRNYAGTLALAKTDAVQMRQVLSQIGNSEFTGYRVLEDGLTESTFSNGAKVYVNYNETVRSAEGHEIAALGYLCVAS